MSSAYGLSPISFFLPAQSGNLFAMYYPSAADKPDRGDVLFVPPFAGEMFAARSVIAACARELEAAGLGVLMIDLHGCGDSAGDFGEARWEIWRDDLAAAVQWLQAQGRDRLHLWGLRLGTLLAMDFAIHSQEAYEAIVLWQPVLSGRKMLTQFFHMNIDEADSEKNIDRLTNPDKRRTLAETEMIEVAGYSLSPALIRAIDNLELAPLGKNAKIPIHWVEFGETAERPFLPESLSVLESWKRNGIRISTHRAIANPFWLFPHCCDAKANG